MKKVLPLITVVSLLSCLVFPKDDGGTGNMSEPIKSGVIEPRKVGCRVVDIWRDLRGVGSLLSPSESEPARCGAGGLWD